MEARALAPIPIRPLRYGGTFPTEREIVAAELEGIAERLHLIALAIRRQSRRQPPSPATLDRLGYFATVIADDLVALAAWEAR